MTEKAKLLIYLYIPINTISFVSEFAVAKRRRTNNQNIENAALYCALVTSKMQSELSHIKVGSHS